MTGRALRVTSTALLVAGVGVTAVGLIGHRLWIYAVCVVLLIIAAAFVGGAWGIAASTQVTAASPDLHIIPEPRSEHTP